MTRATLWKVVLTGVVLFILGAAAGAAAIDMLGEDEAATVTRAETVTTVETRTRTAVDTTTVRRRAQDTLPAGWNRCTNAERGYSVGYPGGWYTTHLNAEQACEYFDPEPFEILEGTEFPPTALFVALTMESVETYVEQLTDPMFFETRRREKVTVGPLRDAVLVEAIATGEGENEPGERRYGYIVTVACAGDVCPKGGRAFVVLATALADDDRYDEFKAVADAAVRSAEFFGS